ncbi:alkaline phosphatase [Chitinophaga sp. GCM10012297]|uniref:Alkaline phosphatase n=1 Tax=Chitinophaga chungangae TaxID=2821488 RepID=A0ABS3YK83_9BACT|nr:alkaline phosphatase [Chitinophaga chungangae]MBO9154539.1 alkaline phosphatase [Chitinophaga chungangae]
MNTLLRNLLLLCCFAVPAQAQYTSANAHSHNDYLQAAPFEAAFARNFGSIEADVFERNGELYVAHTASEIDSGKTLRSLYLEPLLRKIREKKGVFGEMKQGVQLLIDFKTSGVPTMQALIQQLEKYPEITSNPKVQIVISGSRPDASLWKNYPAWILFDGLPHQNYTAEQLERIPLFSDNFRSYTQWNGKGYLVQEDMQKVQAVLNKVHGMSKKFRFWATPDEVNAWKTMINLGVDYINTDKVDALADYLRTRVQAQYQGAAPHAVYMPSYKNNDKQSKVKNVILLIGDGMGLAQIYAGYTGNFGALNLFRLLNIGFSKTASFSNYITDSAAGGTAMASGKKTHNRSVGVDPVDAPLQSIPDLIAPLGMQSALISSGNITDATPGAFYGHNRERSNYAAIAKDFLQSPVSILIGAGGKHFLPLREQLQQKGYRFSTSLSALDTIRGGKFIVLADSAGLSMQKGRGDFLLRSFRKATSALAGNKKGFFLMEEGAQIDYGGHANSVPYLTMEMLDFDRLIGEALRFADSNGETLVIVTADHETGGLSLLDGDIKKGYVDGAFSTSDHTAIMVPVFAYGPHSMDFRGVYENTELFDKIMRVIRRYQN